MDDQVLSQTDLIQRETVADLPPTGAVDDRIGGVDPGFPGLLRHLRGERGWTKAELAKRAEFDPSSITRFEQGNRAPERNTVLQLADAMALPLRDRDSLLAAAGFRSELWDDPLLVELSQVLAEPSLPPSARDDVRSVIRMAIAFCRLQRVTAPERLISSGVHKG